jgi:hypothetical protein
MLTVLLILAIIALITAIAAAMGRCPISVPVILVCIIELLRELPLGK